MVQAMTRNNVINQLDAIALNAYTKKELEQKLNEIFGVELEFDWDTVNWGVDELAVSYTHLTLPTILLV